jgi:hypothetical protein
MKKPEKEITLWEKLKNMGFKQVDGYHDLSFTDKVKNYFGANIEPKRCFEYDYLVKVINGKTVKVALIDIWYTNVTVDGECIFDDRRFDDQVLLDKIELETK